MKKIKLLHSNLDQIVDSLEKFSSTELESFFGGGSGTFEDPYTWEEYCALDSIPDGCWYTYMGHTYQSAGDTDIYNGSSYNGSSYNPSYTPSYDTDPSFSGYNPSDSDGCKRRCDEMLDSTGTVSAGSGSKIEMTGNKNGAAGNATNKATTGIYIIDDNLSKQRPIIVGVDRNGENHPKRNNGVTDHFVVIKGRGVDSEGNIYYTFYDPATSNVNYGTNPNNRLYLDPTTNKLTGNFTYETKKSGKVTVNYTVSEVRPNRE